MSITPPATFTAARLRLRQPTLDDAPALFARYTRDPEVTRYLVWRPHQSIVETERFLLRCASVWSDGSAFPYIIERPDDNALLGMIEMRVDGFKAEYGYVLAREAWGHGYMSEALTSLVAWALAQPGIYRAAAFHDVDNPASGRVMAKAGMEYEGLLRRYSIHPNVSEEPRDCRVYARVRQAGMAVFSLGAFFLPFVVLKTMADIGFLVQAFAAPRSAVSDPPAASHASRGTNG